MKLYNKLFSTTCFISTVLFLVAGCSLGGASQRIPESLENARKLDAAGIGTGKMNLAGRRATIAAILTKYKASLSEVRANEAAVIKQRIETLRFEDRLVAVLLESLKALRGNPDFCLGSPIDCKWIQSQIKAVYVEAGFMKPAGGTIDAAYRRWFDPALPCDPSLVPNAEGREKDYNIWFAIALHIHPAQQPAWLRENVIEAKNLAGYDLTHQFYLLLLLTHCWPTARFGSEYAKRLDKVAQQIVSEEEKEAGFGDISAERVAMLIAGGYGKLVKREWIIRIIDHRLPGGLWPRLPAGETPDPHTTHLALWALAGYQVLLARGETGRAEIFPFKPKFPGIPEHQE